VGNLSHLFVLLKNVKELTVQRSPVYASNVEKPLVLPVTSKHMNEFTLE
jgi:hypothetical protein